MDAARMIRNGVRPRVALACICATAFLIRILHVLSLETIPTGEMVIHIRMATERLTLGHILSPSGFCWLPPGYALFLKPFFLLADPSTALLMVQVAQCVLGAWVCVLLYRLGSRLHSRRAGLLAAMTGCFYPHFVFFPAAWLEENLFVPLLLLSVLLLLRARERGGRRRWYRAGAAAGAAALVQAAAIALIPVAAAAGLRAGTSARAGRIALLLSGFLTLVLPWTARNWIAYGHPVLIAPSTAFELAEAHHPSGDLPEPGLERSPGEVRRATWTFLGQSSAQALADPLAAVHRVSKEGWRRLWELRPPWPLGTSDPQLFAGEMFFPFIPWQLVMVGGITGFGVLAQRRGPGFWILPAAAGCLGLHLLLLFPVTRERLPLEGLFIPCAATAAAGALCRLRVLPGGGHRRLGLFLSAVLLVVLSQSSVRAREVRRDLAKPDALIAREGQFPVIPSPSPRAMFGEAPTLIDRRRGRFLRLSAQIHRQGPWRAEPRNGILVIEYFDAEGRSLKWTLQAAFAMDAIPADRWVDLDLKSHIPPAAAAFRVYLKAETGSPDVVIIDRAAIRYSGGNTAALEFLFPYLRPKE